MWFLNSHEKHAIFPFNFTVCENVNKGIILHEMAYILLIYKSVLYIPKTSGIPQAAKKVRCVGRL